MREGSVGFSVLVTFDVFCVDVDGEGLDYCPDCNNQIIIGLFWVWAKAWRQNLNGLQIITCNSDTTLGNMEESTENRKK